VGAHAVPEYDLVDEFATQLGVRGWYVQKMACWANPEIE
jgi:hypothetical protein